MRSSRRGQVIAAGLTLFLSLAACNGGGDHGGGGPPGAHGAPPGGDGPGAPGAPVAPGGQQGHGGAPGAPYKIPKTVLLDPNVSLAADGVWDRILSDFWAVCTDGTHCVDPVPEFRDIPGVGPCLFYRTEPPVYSHVAYHTRISVVAGAPCPWPPKKGGDSPDGSAPPVSPDGPDVQPPDVQPPDVQPPSSP